MGVMEGGGYGGFKDSLGNFVKYRTMGVINGILGMDRGSRCAAI